MKNIISILVILFLFCGIIQKIHAQENNPNINPLVTFNNKTASCKGKVIFSSLTQEKGERLDICEEWTKESCTITTFTSTKVSSGLFRQATKQVIYFEDVDEDMILVGNTGETKQGVFTLGGWQVAIVIKPKTFVYEYQYNEGLFDEKKSEAPFAFFLKTEKEANEWIEKFKIALSNAKSNPTKPIKPDVSQFKTYRKNDNANTTINSNLSKEEQAKQKIKNESNLITISGKTFYMNSSTIYNSDFETIGSRSAVGIKFDGEKTSYTIYEDGIKKNGKLIHYAKRGNATLFYDKDCKSPYITKTDTQNEKYDILKDGKKIGNCKIAYFKRAELAEIACIIDYFGL